MADEDLGSLAIKIALEDSSFQQGMQNLKREMNVIDSSFKSSIAGIKDWGKNLDSLKNNAQALGDKINVQKQIVQQYQEQLNKSKQSLQENSQKMMDLKGKVESTKTAWEQSKATLGANDEATKKLKQDYEALVKEYEATEKAVLNNNKSIQGYTVQLNNATVKLKGFENELESVNKKINSFSLNKLGEHFNNIGEKLKSVGEGFKNVGEKLTTHFTLPIAGALGMASKSAGEFQHEMADVRKEVAATGIPAAQVNALMKQMGDSSLKWSEDFGQSTEKINEGFLTLVKDGYSASEAMNIMHTSLYTARGADEDLAVVVDQLGSSLEAYGMKTNNAAQTTQNMSHMADAFAYIANHTKANISSLGEAFSTCGATANSLKQPMEQTAAAIGILESNGVDASTAATSLKAGLVNLTKPTKKMQKAMDEMNFTAFDSKGNMKDLATILTEMEEKTKGWTNQQKEAAIATIFGKESLASWNILLHKGGGFLGDLANHAKGATGEVQHLSDSMKDTPVNKFRELKESIHALGVTFGQNVLPVLAPVVQKLTEMVKAFSNLSEGTKKTILIFAGVTAILGPIIVGIGSLITAVGSISSAFGALATFLAEKQLATKIAQIFKIPAISTNIFAGILTGLEAAGTKISAFIFGPWKALGNAFKSLPGLIKSISFADIVTKIMAPFKNIPTLLSGIFGKIPTLLNGMKALFLNFGTTIIGLGPKIFTAIRSAFSIQGIMAGARAALALFTGPWGALALAVATVVGAVIANWDKIKAWVGQHFGGTLPKNFNEFKQVFENVWTSTQQIFTNVWNAIKQVATDVWAYIGPTIMSGVQSVQQFWNEIWPQIQQVFVEVWNVMKVILAPAVAILYTTISGGLGLIKGVWGDAWNLIKDTLKIVWDGMTGVIRIAWDLISGVIKVGLDLLTGNWSKAWADMKSIFSNLWSDIKGLFSSMAQDALTWGKDLVQGIIDGIKGAVGGVKDAVTDVANTIRSYLHFTVPDIGPLADADTYGGDFMQLLADTMNQNSDKPAEAAKKVADLVSEKIKSIKDTLSKETKNLNNQLSSLSQQEEIALRGVKKSARYSIEDEYNAKKKAIKEQIDLRKDQANKEIEQIQKIGKMSKEQIQDELKARKDAIANMNNLNKLLIDSLKQYYKELEDKEKENINNLIDANNKWKDNALDNLEKVYDAKKDELDKEKTLLDRQYSDEDDSDKEAELRKQLGMHYGAEKKKELQQQLNDLIKDRNRRHKKEQLEDQQDTLSKQYSTDKENIEKTAKANNENYKAQIKTVEDFYAEKLKDANIDAEAQKLIVTNNQKEIINLLQSYGKDYELAGSSLGDRLVDGLKNALSVIPDMLESIKSQLNNLKIDTSSLNLAPNSNNSTNSTQQQSSINSQSSYVIENKLILDGKQISAVTNSIQGTSLALAQRGLR